MKNYFNKKNVFIVSSALVVLVIGFAVLNNSTVQASGEADGKCSSTQKYKCLAGDYEKLDDHNEKEEKSPDINFWQCTGKDTIDQCDLKKEEGSCSGSSGNIYGYIETDNVGPIYLSKESYEDITGETSSVNFYTELNHSNPTNLEWSGKGWNEKVGWVDFSYNQTSDIARFVEPGEEHDGGCDDGSCDKWGGWNGEARLAGLVYSTETGVIIGSGIDKHDDTGGDPDANEDDYIGSGEWTFSHVVFQDPPCPQKLNLFINGKKHWYKKECPAEMVKIPLQWTSENVHDCESLGASDFWENKDRDSQNTGTSVTANGDVKEENSPVIFKIRCEGSFTGTSVESVVIASCGAGNDPCGEDGADCINIISPILIEA